MIDTFFNKLYEIYDYATAAARIWSKFRFCITLLRVCSLSQNAHGLPKKHDQTSTQIKICHFLLPDGHRYSLRHVSISKDNDIF